MGRMILILGGARSGKSHHAMKLAEELAGEGGVIYLATAEAGDEEMAARIRRHRRDRPRGWQTVEEPLDLVSALGEAGSAVMGERGQCVVIVDCITLWVSNLMLAQEREAGDELEDSILLQAEALSAAARQGRTHVVLVSNEVGLGVVPPTRLGRAFRDISGRVHQLLAQAADEVYVMWAGLPQRIK